MTPTNKYKGIYMGRAKQKPPISSDGLEKIDKPRLRAINDRLAIRMGYRARVALSVLSEMEAIGETK